MKGPARDSEIGDAVKRARVRSGQSQRRVSVAMRGLGWRWTQSTVSEVEHGAKSLRLAEALDLAEILETPLLDLVSDGPIRRRGLGRGMGVLILDGEYAAADSARVGAAFAALEWLEVEAVLLALGVPRESLGPLEREHALAHTQTASRDGLDLKGAETAQAGIDAPTQAFGLGLREALTRARPNQDELWSQE